ncbi:hypothetical protein BU25DRAFT_413952 [Macroventuria anomochaeta]|uniref:Uncharacterized protein n=1 Tax=Macroventuria anomochaeta TaxID=301207 RepID=A0ACB6RQ38_9PLEO|nr:uncharacterized protein BU25DRAFT_413952 [Macroventuria anomochaeta]KAF2624080.1 hypothetical protein BU25DRAFT_413952 [Macroventuria anomochaeta]
MPVAAHGTLRSSLHDFSTRHAQRSQSHDAQYQPPPSTAQGIQSNPIQSDPIQSQPPNPADQNTRSVLPSVIPTTPSNPRAFLPPRTDTFAPFPHSTV